MFFIRDGTRWIRVGYDTMRAGRGGSDTCTGVQQGGWAVAGKSEGTVCVCMRHSGCVGGARVGEG